MRILIVDDEMVSRMKLETMLAPIGECKTADCGVAAVSLYEHALSEEAAFDLVMLDIDMPDMQGPDVLKRLRKMENFGPHRAMVVMVTAQLDQEHVLTCLKCGCDEYIAKPFDPDTINAKLKKLGMVKGASSPSDTAAESSIKMSDRIFMEIFEAVRTGKIKLPVMPQIAVEFRDYIKNNADIDQITQLLKQDVAMSAKLVQVANSALYRGFGKVQNIEQAVTRLGVSKTEKMVVALSHRQMFNTVHRKYKDTLSRLWQHSLASAYAAERTTAALGLNLSIDPFSAGLFHDIGALALLTIIAQMDSLGRYNDNVDSTELNETIDNYHAMFGAKLLEMWGYDTPFTNTTLGHNRLDAAVSLTPELLIIHFANLVAKSLGFTTDGKPFAADLRASDSAKELQLHAGQIEELTTAVDERMNQSAGFLD